MNAVMQKSRDRYLLATVGTVFFAAVYESFSHQVYSDAMIFAFLYPLLGGLIPASALLFAPRRLWPGALSRCLWGSGLAALTVGSVFQGILEIYGTTSRFRPFYTFAGIVLALCGLAVWLLWDLRASK